MGSASLLLLALAAANSPARPMTATATASVRILTPALVGAELSPPREGMRPRDTEIVQRDGSTIRLRLYEFE